MKPDYLEPAALRIEGESITFRRGTHRWTVPAESVVAVGEATNQSGPWRDDWFVYLITRPEGRWFEAPADVSGIREVLAWLSTRFGEPMQLRLGNSTDFKSRVLWPPALRDKSLFEFSVPEPVFWWQRMLKVFRLWPWHNLQRVHGEVLRELGARIS